MGDYKTCCSDTVVSGHVIIVLKTIVILVTYMLRGRKYQSLSKINDKNCSLSFNCFDIDSVIYNIIFLEHLPN